MCALHILRHGFQQRSSPSAVAMGLGQGAQLPWPAGRAHQESAQRCCTHWRRRQAGARRPRGGRGGPCRPVRPAAARRHQQPDHRRARRRARRQCQHPRRSAGRLCALCRAATHALLAQQQAGHPGWNCTLHCTACSVLSSPCSPSQQRGRPRAGKLLADLGSATWKHRNAAVEAAEGVLAGAGGRIMPATGGLLPALKVGGHRLQGLLWGPGAP